MSDDLRERVARAIDPEAFEAHDTCLSVWESRRDAAYKAADAALAEIGAVRDEGSEMKLAYDAYRKGQRDALDGIRVADPRVILSRVRAIAEGKDDE